ncbi:MAG: hypothetical protein AAFY71_15000 [Bacteroidota bacterium]
MSKLLRDILQQATGLTSEEQLALISQLSQQLAGKELDGEKAEAKEKTQENAPDWFSAFYTMKMRLAE